MSPQRKAFYSEHEAARSLGMSTDQFRVLLKRYIVDSDEELPRGGRSTFHAADVLLMKLFITRAVPLPGAPTPQGSPG